MKIKKNDQVKILAGKDRGKTGKVLRVLSAENKIIIEGLNIVKKHVKARKEGESGQRIEIPGKLNISNAMLVCPKCGKATRIEYKITEKNKLRICKQCKAEL
jgi:large subunit ribosomal protein L24